MMKKLATLFLALILCAGCLCAAAEENAPMVTDMPVAGLTMRWPLALTETKGSVFADGAYDLDGGIYYAYWYYCAAPRADALRLMEEDPSALPAAILFYTFSVAQNKPLSELVEYLNSLGLNITEEDLAPIGEQDDWHFYLCMGLDPDFAAAAAPEYAEEYAALGGMREEIAASFACSVPFNEYGDLSGRIIRFEGTDLDGNPVTSEALFAQNKVTLVNIWATWCGPCVGELSELQAIHLRSREKGCAVVGLMIDDDVEAARRLVQENGITYPIVLVSGEFSMVFPFSAIPTTFYVDGSGRFMETKFTGAYPDMYEDALYGMLEQL